jgi:predicted ATPase
MQQPQAIADAVGANIGRTERLCLFAEVYALAGRLNDALTAVTEALAAVEQQNERYYEAEILRLKGELLLKMGTSTIEEAQGCFERAITVSCAQSGKALELRATTSLARLLAKQGRREEARTMLAAIYNWFTEGFDTADLKDAKALLVELNQES